jgi:DNA-binding Xre family transcriptional regulator
MTVSMRLCQLLDLWMSSSKISVRDMAREIGLDHTVLHRFRHGEDCTNQTLAKILKWALSNVPKKDA